LTEFGELRIFREESVAGMDGIGSDLEREIDDLAPVEKAFDRPGTDDVSLIGLFDIDAGLVGL
jgi:hypothetical protein